MADSVETLGVDLRTRVKKLGVKEKARRKKCKVRFSIIKNNEVFQKNYMSEHGASRDAESACSRDGSYGMINN